MKAPNDIADEVMRMMATATVANVIQRGLLENIDDSLRAYVGPDNIRRMLFM